MWKACRGEDDTDVAHQELGQLLRTRKGRRQPRARRRGERARRLVLLRRRARTFHSVWPVRETYSRMERFIMVFLPMSTSLLGRRPCSALAAVSRRRLLGLVGVGPTAERSGATCRAAGGPGKLLRNAEGGGGAAASAWRAFRIIIIWLDPTLSAWTMNALLYLSMKLHSFWSYLIFFSMRAIFSDVLFWGGDGANQAMKLKGERRALFNPNVVMSPQGGWKNAKRAFPASERSDPLKCLPVRSRYDPEPASERNPDACPYDMTRSSLRGEQTP